MSSARFPPRAGDGYNRLAAEKSPYLLQHADNPVDWFPWGPEAFTKAREEDKPIFLSIGYSTCHWCHVMEHESFEDPDVARLMNETFVSIKVDREERPDVDGVYMAVCQMMTGGGGWPLTIIMTPEGRPFFAATYIPKESRRGRAGMLELIPHIGGLWANRRDELLSHSDRVIAALRQNSFYSPGEEPDESTLDLAYRQLAARFDEREGGFGTSPKFPTPHNLLFLLRYWKRTGEENALVMVERTLQAMRRGGIFDQVGYGFHRYSTDARWLVPHFEKMLYDQALLAMAYIEAYQATQKEEHASAAREIFTYVLRDMTAPEGAFYSAEDADSEGEEGKFYLWTYEEVTQLLSEEEADLAVEVFNVERGGNYIDEVMGRRADKNILHLSRPMHDLARERDLPIEELRGRLEAIRRRLFEHRETRVRPDRDDKILTDWNGLMIAALAKGSRALSEPSYAEVARRAADFIVAEMLTDGEHLLHRYRDGNSAIPALLDDYAFLIWGLVELHEATFEVRYLETALALTRHLIEHFWDETNGGFFFTGDEGEELLMRQKESSDGALPSGNSVAMLDLLRLGRIIADADLEQKAIEVGRAFSETVRPAPAAYTQLMIALDFTIGPTYEVVVIGRSNADDTRAMLAALEGRFLPNKVVILRPLEEDEPAIDRHVEYVRNYSSIDGKATAYVCTNYSCQLPTTEIGAMLELLGER